MLKKKERKNILDDTLRYTHTQWSIIVNRLEATKKEMMKRNKTLIYFCLSPLERSVFSSSSSFIYTWTGLCGRDELREPAAKRGTKYGRTMIITNRLEEPTTDRAAAAEGEA